MMMVIVAFLWGIAQGDRDFKYTPDWKSLDNRPLPPWFDQDKFGIFLHWGVFSVPSFRTEWYWEYLHDGKKEFVDFHDRTYGKEFKYQEFAPMFKAKLFDPDRWARIFKNAGARYVILTSKHHEGFTLWPSKVSWMWNAMDVGPKRDLVGDLARSVRKAGLRFGLYHSMFEWFNPLYAEDKKNNYTTRTFVTGKTMVELRELVTNYHPDVIWSDGDWDVDSDYWQSKEFLAWLYNDSPVKDTVVVNDRWGRECPRKHGGYYSGADRQQPEPELLNHKWENAMTVDRGTWGFSRVSELSDYLTAQDIIKELVSTVAFNGNLLLNVGPTSDGIIAPIFEERLTQIGDYLRINGDAIFGSKPFSTQNATSDGMLAYFTFKDGCVFYLTVGLPWSESSSVFVPLPASNHQSSLLTRDGEHSIPCTRAHSGKGYDCTISAPVVASRVLDPNGLAIKFCEKRSIVV